MPRESEDRRKTAGDRGRGNWKTAGDRSLRPGVEFHIHVNRRGRSLRHRLRGVDRRERGKLPPTLDRSISPEVKTCDLSLSLYRCPGDWFVDLTSSPINAHHHRGLYLFVDCPVDGCNFVTLKPPAFLESSFTMLTTFNALYSSKWPAKCSHSRNGTLQRGESYEG